MIQNPTPIREGDTVTLFCNYTSSNPSVTRYEWNPPGSGNEPEAGVLMIQKVAWNAKSFTCAACNQWCSWAPAVNLHVQCECPRQGTWRVAQVGYGALRAWRLEPGPESSQ